VLLHHSKSFNVIQVGINQKPICDFILVINSIWYPISYRFGVIAAYYSNFGHCIFEPPFGRHRELRASCSGLPIRVNWTYFARCNGWGATAENRLKICDFAPMQSVWPKISHRRRHPQPTTFTQIVRPMNALQLCRWQFSNRETL